MELLGLYWGAIRNYNFSLSGKLNGFVGSKPQMINHEYQEISSETTFSNVGKLLPVYSSTEKFAQRSIRSSIQKILQCTRNTCIA